MSNTDVDDQKETRESIADHEFVDAQGNEVEETESATGYRYTLLELKNEPFVWMYDQANDLEKRMLALFGAKTLATNESSAIRNNKKYKLPGGKSTAPPREQLNAVLSRFKLINEGQWIDPTREGGIRVDKPKLAAAVVQVKIDIKKIAEAQRDAEYATTLQKLEEDAEYLRKVRQVAEVAAVYASLMGRTTATVNDL